MRGFAVGSGLWMPVQIVAALFVVTGCESAGASGTAPRSNGSTPGNLQATPSALAVEPPLRALTANIGEYFGAAVTGSHMALDPQLASAVAREASAITMEGDLQWINTERLPGKFDFRGADALMRFADQNRLAVRGHALVWAQGLPSWLDHRLRTSDADSALRRHIEVVMGRYAGRIRSWDVVNEAIEPLDGRADGLRRNVWLETVGPDYIARAFRVAHRVDPAAQLVYNDYLLELNTPEADAKREATLRLLRTLVQAGVPINALGIQAHSDPLAPFDEKKLHHFLDQVAGLGLTVIVTELDVYDFGLPGDIIWRDAIVAATYRRVLRAFLSHRAVEGVITWGLSDRYSWLDRKEIRADGMPFRGLLLDAGFSRKPAWAAIGEELRRSEGRRR